MIQLERYKEDKIFYSENKIHKPIEVIVLDDYIIQIQYDDGKIINFDMKKLLNHPLFKPLNDKVLFEKVTINGSAICWENDIDICADSIYINN